MDSFYVYFLWHFCSLFVMPAPHLSPSLLSAQLAPPPPPPREDPYWGPYWEGGWGGLYSDIEGGGEGRQCVMGGGGVVCVVLFHVQYFYSSLPPLSPHIFPPSVFPVF